MSYRTKSTAARRPRPGLGCSDLVARSQWNSVVVHCDRPDHLPFAPLSVTLDTSAAPVIGEITEKPLFPAHGTQRAAPTGSRLRQPHELGGWKGGATHLGPTLRPMPADGDPQHASAAHPHPHPAAELDAALADADLRVLLMCLVHLTGDRRWIQPPFTPRRDVRLIADPQAGFSNEVADMIRDAVRNAVNNDSSTHPRITDPGDELLGEMMNVCLGEQVPPEYLPMVRIDMGFDPGVVEWPGAAPGPGTSDEFPDTTTVLIIGAGISGLCLAMQMHRLGIAFRIVEKNPQVGGTWLENRYPGCGVDTPNHFYSYSFAPNPAWTHFFSQRDELLGYVQNVADDHALTSRVEYRTAVDQVTWSEADHRWDVRISTDNGPSTIRARVVVGAIGHFNRPAVAPFDGAERFTGPMFHTAHWPDGLDLTDKRVAIIGTGASSMQIVPAIVDTIRALTIFQRSPQWARNVPHLNDPVRPAEGWLLRNLPYYATWTRFTQFWRYGDGLLRFLKKDPDWPHPERSLNRINDRHRQEMTDHIVEQLDGRPDLLQKCIPTYPPYGKRILLDKGWFAALKRPQVTLTTDPITSLDETGVLTADGTHHDADVVVIATGFSVTDHAARLNITGRNALRLADDWADDNPSAHLGITVPGFPNLFLMGGPNTNAGHGGSGFLMAEAQTRYITSCIVELLSSGHASMDVLPSVRGEYVQRVDDEHETLVWTHPGMSTYYRNKYGRVVSPMPFRLIDYWHSTRAVDPAEFTWT